MYRVEDSLFEVASLLAENLHEGSLVVGSGCETGNVFEDGGVALGGFADAKVEMRFNVFGGPVIVDHLPGTGGRYRVAYNDIRPGPAQPAMALSMPGTSRLDVIVGRNRLETDGATAVFTGDGTAGVAIVQNHVAGTAAVGLWLGPNRPSPGTSWTTVSTISRRTTSPSG